LIHEATVKVGESITLTASVLPSTALQSVWWSSDNPTVATIDRGSGAVRGVSEGTAIITATSADGGKTAMCVVTVEADGDDDPEPGTNVTVTLDRDLIELRVGDNDVIVATVAGTTSVVVWTSSNTSVAIISSAGRITAVGEGSTIITATVDGKTAVCVVNVKTEASAGTASEIEAVVTVSSGNATVSAAQINALVEKVKEAQRSGINDITVNFDAGSLPLTISSFRSLADTGADVRITTGSGYIVIPGSVAKKIAPSSATESLKIFIESVLRSDLNNAQRANTEDNAKVFSITVVSGNSEINDLGGTIKVFLRYAPPKGVSMNDVLLTYLGEDGSTENVPFTYYGGYIEAAVLHLSYYAADYTVKAPSDTPVVNTAPTGSSSDDTVLIVSALAIVAVLVIALAAVFLVRRT
jgi:hypothetical protein